MLREFASRGSSGLGRGSAAVAVPWAPGAGFTFALATTQWSSRGNTNQLTSGFSAASLARIASASSRVECCAPRRAIAQCYAPSPAGELGDQAPVDVEGGLRRIVVVEEPVVALEVGVARQVIAEVEPPVVGDVVGP